MAVQIRTFAISQLTIGAAGNFHDRVYKAIETATPAALHVETLAPAYKAVIDKIASVVNRQRAYVSTETLQSLDITRDNGCRTVINIADASKTSLVPEKNAASAHLRPQLSSYKKTPYHEYAKQTLEIRGMINALRDPANAEAVAALGLEAEIDALEAANNAFDEAFEQRTQEAAAHADLSDLDSKALANEANRIYAEITQTVNAYAIVQPTDEINTFIQTVNGYVVSFSEIIDSGSSGGSTGDEPTDPTDPTEPTDPDDDSGTPGGV